MTIGSLAWKLNRLRTMGPQEIGHRVLRSALARVEAAGIGVVHTPPEADAISIGKPWVCEFPSELPTPLWTSAADKILDGSWSVFSFRDIELGLPPDWNSDPLSGKAIPLVFGKTLDYRDTARVGDIRIVWELNRHAELCLLAQAYALTKEARYAEGFRTLLVSWISQCPYLRGANWVSSLELAIRLTNWAFSWHLLGGTNNPLFLEQAGQEFRRVWLGAIYQHCHFIANYLSRHSSANNHLLGELAGLFIASVTWQCWPESLNWQTHAKRELEIEACKQNSREGVNLEQAFYYHHETLEWMLLAILWGEANSVHFSGEYRSRVEGMLAFIAAVMDHKGHVPMVGDADDANIASFCPDHQFDTYRSLLATGAVLFDRFDFASKAKSLDYKTHWLLGDGAMSTFANIQKRAERLDLPREFPESGYFVLGSDFDTDNEVRILADTGPLGYLSIAAHGHADALAFTLSVGGNEVLVDPGTYTYQGEMRWREYFRGTAAHNTLVVDDLNQSLSGGRFMWLSHANARCIKLNRDRNEQVLVAEHDGYMRLPDQVKHQREWRYKEAETTLLVTDTVHATIDHHLGWHWHFAEDVTVSIESDSVVARVPGWRVEILPPTGCKPRILRGAEAPIGGWISRRFESKVPTSSVLWDTIGKGSARWETRFKMIKVPNDA